MIILLLVRDNNSFHSDDKNIWEERRIGVILLVVSVMSSTFVGVILLVVRVMSSTFVGAILLVVRVMSSTFVGVILLVVCNFYHGVTTTIFSL